MTALNFLLRIHGHGGSYNDVTPRLKAKMTLGTTILGSIVACIVGATGVVYQARPSERVIPWEYGVSIASRLQPGDEQVFVDRLEIVDSVELNPEPTVAQAIRYAAQTSKTVIVIAVNRVVGKLSADGSWVETVVEGSVRDALKSARPLSKDERVTVEYSGGGEMTIGSVRVRAGTPFRVQAERQYLMFLESAEGTDRLFAGTALRIEDGKLISLAPPERTKRDIFDGLSLDMVTKEIRAFVRQNNNNKK